jgi:hypothetical protein
MSIAFVFSLATVNLSFEFLKSTKILKLFLKLRHTTVVRLQVCILHNWTKTAKQVCNSSLVTRTV